MMTEKKTFQPRGDRLPLPALDKLSAISQADVEQAMRQADKDLKPYLDAK